MDKNQLRSRKWRWQAEGFPTERERERESIAISRKLPMKMNWVVTFNRQREVGKFRETRQG